jgi:hypothetical protein
VIFGNFVHVFFNDSRNCFIVETVASFTMLEEVVRVLSHTTCYRSCQDSMHVYGIQPKPLVNKWSEVFVPKSFNLLNLVRSTEAIEEVDKRNASLDSCKVSYTCQDPLLLEQNLRRTWQNLSDEHAITS